MHRTIHTGSLVGLPPVDPLRDVTGRHRAALGRGDSTEALHAKLSQLSRFGLGADDQPLLSTYWRRV